jgi:Polyketide cyclase / dehydrase and lipid transport
VPIDTFEHRFVVDAAPDVIYRHLSDPNSYVGLSPLVVHVRDIRLGQDDDGRNIIEYVAVERVRAGRLHWDYKVAVLLTLTRPGVELASYRVLPGRVRTEATVTLEPALSGTHVHERLEVQAPAVLQRFAVDQARSIQLTRAEALARRFATASGK